MTDNVIILGAGASVDAGIPVLSNFVDKMLNFALTGKNGDVPLSEEDKTVFSEAMKVRNELDGYHGRASFDDRNIEDILSILSFNLIGEDELAREKLNWMAKAIARTIELTCKVKHDGQMSKIQDLGPQDYRDFWENLFKRFENSVSAFPSIISFNYDLVLERSLFQTLIGTTYAKRDYYSTHLFPFDGININYQYKNLNDISYSVRYVGFDSEKELHADDGFGIFHGTTLEKCDVNKLENPVNIEILKLHGSLNFPNKEEIDKTKFLPTNLSSEPYIIPPIINKSISNEQTMWGVGLKRLREAKNIIIVGYSLPQTDIYMQYFIKAGIGPNKDLNKIFVFNPVLYRNDEENERMKKRFENCFSSQLRNRIEFEPKIYDNKSNGTFAAFVEHIYYNEELFFGSDQATQTFSFY